MDRGSREAGFLTRLREQCAARAPLFDPARERAEVNRLVDDALGQQETAREGCDALQATRARPIGERPQEKTH